MLECSMNLLQEFFQANYGKTITVTVSTGPENLHKSSNYHALLRNFTMHSDGSATISLQDTAIKASIPTSNIIIPQRAVITNNENILTIRYTTKTQEPVTITVSGTKISSSLPAVNEEPFIRDIKNAQGKTTKIVLSIPQTYPDKLYFEQAAKLLHAILTDWAYISLAVRKAIDITWLHRNIQYSHITPVFLPGDTFFQILAYDKKEQVTIDLATSMTISIERAIMTYEFDGMSYELIRGDKG